MCECVCSVHLCVRPSVFGAFVCVCVSVCVCVCVSVFVVCVFGAVVCVCE